MPGILPPLFAGSRQNQAPQGLLPVLLRIPAMTGPRRTQAPPLSHRGKFLESNCLLSASSAGEAGSRTALPVQGSSPQSLRPLAGLGPEPPRPHPPRCPPALRSHLAAPYPHPAPSADGCSQKPHAQPPDQYPAAKGCQSDLCPERQTETLPSPPRAFSPCPAPRAPPSVTWLGPGWGPS